MWQFSPGYNSRPDGKGIPDDAFSPVEGDDKKVASHFKKINKEQHKSHSLSKWQDDYKDYSLICCAKFAALDDVDESNPDLVHLKKQQYNDLLSSESFNKEKFLADLWTSTFFWKLNDTNANVPTQSIFLNAMRDVGAVGPEIRKNVNEIASKHKFFHWHLEFPDVFGGDDPGFDCVLGNPPWEKLTILEKEFFSNIPSISKEKRSNIRKEYIERLKVDQPVLYKSWIDKKRDIKKVQLFITKSKRFSFSARGELNTYPLFVELGINLQKKLGKTGLIIKSGMLSSPTWSDFTSYLIESNRLESIYDFRNWKKWFPIGFHERFSLITLKGLAFESNYLTLGFYIDEVNEICVSDKIFKIKRTDLIKLNPTTKSIPNIKSKKDMDILLNIYRNHPIISCEYSQWNIRYTRGIDLSTQANLLKSKEELENIGYKLNKFNIFVGDNNDCYYPLIEGKFIQQYDHRFSSFEGIPKEKRFGTKPGTHAPSNHEKNSPKYHILPRYWISKKDFLEDFNKRKLDVDWNICFRDTTNVISNQRTSVACINSKVAYNYKAPNIDIICNDKLEKNKKRVMLLALVNSIPFDYVVRQKFYGANLIKSILYQISVPTYENVSIHYELILSKVLKLMYTSNTLEDFAKDLDYSGKPFEWDEMKRLHLKAELDAIFSLIYSLTKEEVEYILEDFIILKNKQISEFGHYLTKKLVLEYYDKYKKIIKPVNGEVV